MIALEHYIEYLLTTHDCVVIPGLGGFVAQYEPAYWDKEGRFMPPVRNISFNNDLSHSDGLLATLVARVEAIDYEQAVHYVAQEVSELQCLLKNNRRAEWGSFGVLSYTSVGTLTLALNNEQSYNVADMGYGTLRIKPIKEATTVPVIAHPSSQTSDRINISIKRSSLYRIAAAAVIIVCVMLGVSTPIPAPTVTDYAAMVPVQLTVPAAKQIRQEPVVATVDTTARQATAHQAIQEPRNYILVIGTFVNPSAAKTQMELLSAKGIDNIQLYTSATRTRLYIQSFGSFDEANRYKNEACNHPLLQDAWIMSIR